MNSPRRMSSSRWSWISVAVAACALVSSTRSLAECALGYELHPEYYTFSVGAKPMSVATGDWNEDGRRVRVWRWGSLAPGIHSVVWDGQGASGEHLGPGVYFCRLRVGDERAQRKIVLRN